MIGWIRSLDRILKGEATRPAMLRAGTIEAPVGGLSTLLVILGAIYGACMGTFAVVSRWGGPAARGGWAQMGYSAVKVPMLFVLTLLITLPSLYVFNALVGCRLAFGAVLRLLVAALGVSLAVLASFGTIVAFFSLCTSSYPFMVLLNVLLFAVAGILGMSFLLQTLHRLAVARATESAASPPLHAAPAATSDAGRQSNYPELALPTDPGALDRLHARTLGPHVRTVFSIWVIVFGLIGAQMGWVLRPFIGAPGVPVTFFRARESNFFEAVVSRAQEMAGEWQAPARTGAAPSTQPDSACHR
jgi:hypothetical protein